ncbi:GTPase [Halosegnis marinus]|uniref:GTPase n=1 Tax=Halosegnis marinus TaxID=3034023 RepID=UPI003616F92F
MAAEGHEVCATLAATRREHPDTNLGPALLDRVATAVRDHDAETVAVDADLTPAQTLAVADELPDGVRVRDRTRVVLDTFADRAGTEAARVQVRIGRLEYERELQRELLSAGDVEGFWPDDDHRSVRAIERRLTKARAELRDLPDPRERYRDRREAGFDLVAVVGYTNAGKSTLVRRLADDMTLDRAGSGSASVEDRPFETLSTTTRRATLNGRRVLLTDTVGFVSDLPHDLVRSFDATFAAAYEADAVLLVVDAADPPERMARKVRVAREQLSDADGTVVPVLNKTDAASDERLRAAADRFDGPVTASATEGDLADVRERLLDALPTATATLDLPNDGESMSLVSWCHDRADVRSVEYGERVTVELAGNPAVVAEAERRASEGEAAGQ